MSAKVPTQARAVVVGGGIAGVSTAYHLAKLGVTDVVLLEQGKLTCGTTWHAAGLVGQTRATRNATRMSRYGIDLYASLEQETGLATGWKQCGSLNVARTPERLVSMQRQMARAKSFGIEFEFVSPAEAGRRVPILRTDDLAGAVWIPGDGKANPTDLAQSLAKGARMRGATIVEGIKVTSVDRAAGRVTGIRWRTADDEGAIACEALVNCGGQWARAFGRLAGVNVPLYAAEHFYLVTKAIAGVTSDMPVIRDPDGYLYYKEEVGGLVMGGFEPKAKPWNVDPIPDGFEFQLLPEDWDHFEILMENAIHRTPCLETAEVKLLLNGPESFTLDGNFILGEAPELAGYFVCAGFNSAGIANAGGAGKLVAEWIVNGGAPLDLWDVDTRRFAPFHGNRRHLADRTVETLGLHYAMRWPREELETVRPLRRSPLYDRLAAKRAVFGSKMNWERANYFLPPGAHKPPYTLDTPGWLPHVLEEQRACREDVVVFDQTSFSKFVLKGRDALAVLQRTCANEIDVPVGRMVYTGMLNARGGFESDLTVVRLGADEFFIITGSAQTTRDFAWIERAIRADEHAALVDVTSAYSVISVMGPKAEALLGRVSPDDLSRDGNAVRHHADDRCRVRAGARSTDELRRRTGLRALRAHRPMRDALRRAVGPRRRIRLEGCRVLHDRRAAHRGRPPRVGRGTVARRDAVGSGPGLRCEDGQAGRFRRSRGPAGAARQGHHQAPRHVHVRRSGGLPLGRRTDPDGRPERRRIDVDGLFAPPRTSGRDGLRARRLCAHGRRWCWAPGTMSTLPANSTP